MSSTLEMRSSSKLHNQVLFDAQTVDRRIDEMAGECIDRYRDRNPQYLCLLNGGLPFSSRLMGSMVQLDSHLHPDLKYLLVSAYDDKREIGRKKIEVDDWMLDRLKVMNRDVVLLDDVVDTGKSGSVVRDRLMEKGAASVELVALVLKDVVRDPAVPSAAIFGFEAPNVWLTGMGMDDAGLAPEANRFTPYVAVALGAEL